MIKGITNPSKPESKTQENRTDPQLSCKSEYLTTADYLTPSDRWGFFTDDRVRASATPLTPTLFPQAGRGRGPSLFAHQ